MKIIKIGGEVVDNPQLLEEFLKDFAQIEEPKVLVHGGGKLATKLADTIGLPTTMIEGRRVTTPQMLDVVTMVYAGLISKKLAAQLQALGCNAIGVSGADAGLMIAKRRPAEPIDFGNVADLLPENINIQAFEHFFEQGITPVCCSIVADAEGNLLNCNADTIASCTAIALAKKYPVELIYSFGKLGVLKNIEDENSWIAHITSKEYPLLKEEKIITEGMIPKIDNAFYALQQGVKEVLIKHVKNIKNNIGTVLTLE